MKCVMPCVLLINTHIATFSVHPSKFGCFCLSVSISFHMNFLREQHTHQKVACACILNTFDMCMFCMFYMGAVYNIQPFNALECIQIENELNEKCISCFENRLVRLVFVSFFFFSFFYFHLRKVQYAYV